MDGAAACLIAVILNRKRFRFRVRIRPPSDRLALYVRAQFLPLEVAQFIERAEVHGGQTRAALQTYDFHARFAQLGRQNSARRPHSDDDDISLFDCHGSALPLLVFGLRLQADHRRPRECLSGFPCPP